MSDSVVFVGIVAVIFAAVGVMAFLAVVSDEIERPFESRCRTCDNVIEYVSGNWAFNAEYFERYCRNCKTWERPRVQLRKSPTP